MRCALLIPAWLPEELFPKKTVSSQLNYWQPLGTLYVAACLKKAGHEVEFLNGAFLTRAQILQKLKQFDPKFIGIYSTTFGWNKALQAIDEIKSILRSGFICVGGPFPIAKKELCLQHHKGIDAVVTAEAEITVPKIVECLENGKSLLGVAGCIFRDHDKIVDNGPQPLIEDLDSIPFPARELLDDAKLYMPPPATYKKKPVAVVMTARGCDRRCIFCFQIDKQRKCGTRGVRFRSVENVMQEVELVLSQGYKEIKFLDDTLAADYDRLMELTLEIKRRKLKFPWFASACVNQVDKPLLKSMKEAGCWAVLFGAESGVQKNINTLRKGFTIEHVKAAVAAAKEVGLKVTTPFVFGIPGETYEEALQTIDFALELNPDFANFHALTAFPGTPLHDNLEKYGSVSQNLSDFTYQGASFTPYTMTREQIHSLRHLAFKRFYSRPGFLLHKVFQLRGWSDWIAAVKGVKSLMGLHLEKDLFGLFNKTKKTVQR